MATESGEAAAINQTGVAVIELIRLRLLHLPMKPAVQLYPDRDMFPSLWLVEKTRSASIGSSTALR